MLAARVLWISLALLVLARGLLSFLPSMWGWGLNVQRFLDPFFGWALWSVAALTLVPSVAARGVQTLEKLGDWLAHSRRAHAVAWVLGAALALVMPDRVWFVGDFMIRMGNVELGSFHTSFIHALPLDRWLHGALLTWGRGSAESANLALRALGAIEAGLLAALAVAFARALRLSGIFAVIAAGIVFFGGYLTMFTGLGKPASEMCLATVALATFGLRAIENRSSLLPCGLVMAGALLLHRSSILFLPTWLVLLGLWFRSAPADSWKRQANVLGLAAPIAVAVFALPRIVAIAAGYDLSHHLVLAETFSPRRLIDLANLGLALSPLAFVIPALLALWRATWSRKDAVLLIVLALSFAPLLLIAPQQGIFRDWDVFAPAGIALSLLAAYAVVETVVAVPGRTWLAVSALALVMVSSIQWLALNRDEQRGLARVGAYLVETPGPTAAERPLLWDFLTSRNIRSKHWKEAADAAGHAAADAPHRRIFLTWGLAATMAEDYATAERAYLELLEREPDDPLGWLGLAGVAWRLNDRQQLNRALAKLRSYPPDGSEMAVIRRHLGYYPQVWPAPDSVVDWSPQGAASTPAPDTLVIRSGALHLRALFYRPPGRGPFPGVLFNHGSGHGTGASASGVRDQRHPEILGPLFARHGYAFLYLYRRGDGLSRSQGIAAADAMDEALRERGQSGYNEVQLRRLAIDDMDDALAGLAALRARPEVDPGRVAIVGHSFGGSLSLIVAARDTGLRAGVIFSGAGLSWDRSPQLRDRLRAAAMRARAPLFFIHAANDFSTAAGESLAIEITRLGRPARVEVYPAIGSTPEEGHQFVHSGVATWERDVFAFLDPRMNSFQDRLPPR